MGEDHTGPVEGDDAATIREGNRGDNREIYAPSGWVTTQQAAKALDVSTRTVRWHIERGNLEARPEGEGVRRAWLVSIDSLQTFRSARQAAGEHAESVRKDPDIAADIPGSPIRELADRLAEEAARAAEFRVRLELSERAQSTLEEELAEERRRREEAEQEREDLRRELEALKVEPQASSEPRESPASPGPDTPQSPAEDAHGAAERPFTEEEPQPERSWWRRFFGF